MSQIKRVYPDSVYWWSLCNVLMACSQARNEVECRQDATPLRYVAYYEHSQRDGGRLCVGLLLISVLIRSIRVPFLPVANGVYPKRELLLLYQSPTHSHTLPAMSSTPYGLAPSG